MTNIPTLIFAFVATTGVFLIIRYRHYLPSLLGATVAITVLLLSSTLPAMASPYLAALGADDATVTEGRAQQEEQLKLDPGGDQYEGIEYAPNAEPGERTLSDSEIRSKVESMSDRGVVVAVTNGSVRLSGKIKDKETASKLVEDIKSIPGVHEITFDLGITETSFDEVKK